MAEDLIERLIEARTYAYMPHAVRAVLTEATAALTASAAEVRELNVRLSLARSGLEVAIERFTEYAALHAAKGTPDGDEKAARNADLAYSLRCCLPDAPPMPGSEATLVTATGLSCVPGGNNDL